MNELHFIADALRVIQAVAAVALGIGCIVITLSCICRLNAARVTPGRVTLTQALYLSFGYWSFMTFFELIHQGADYAGACEVAVGLGIILHLHLSYKQWKGEDAVGDFLHTRIEDGHAPAIHQ